MVNQEHNSVEALPEETGQGKELSRRQLLKIIAATSGAVVGSVALPDEWNSPIIETGVLPAHAQGSPTSPPGLPSLACIEAGQGTGIDLMLALDTSGSISAAEEVKAQDLANARTALTAFIDQLALAGSGTDRVGLVTFGTGVDLQQSLTNDSDQIKQAIATGFSGGLTNIAGAVDTAQAELTANSIAANKSTIILISDGFDNQGGDPDASAQTAKNAGTRVITVALGNFADFSTLRTMASSVPDFYFTPASIDLVTIFSPGCNL